MNWQVNYALANLKESIVLKAELVRDDLIKVIAQNRPDVLAAIVADETIDLASAVRYKEKYPELDFLCGYRNICVWEGDAIRYLRENSIGWGNSGTLSSAVLAGDANTASHKTYKFSDRLLRQYGRVAQTIREFDRVYSVTLKNGVTLRIGMIAEYEPTADVIRSFWERFGPIDIAWNINPNGNPPDKALEAGRELGCKVMKWEELKAHMI